METTVPTKKASNRRASLRRKPRGYVRVECRMGTYGFGANVGTNVLDVSESGIRLITKSSLGDCKEVEIIVSSHGVRKPIKRMGYVRWEVTLEDGNFCVGVEFQKRLEYRDWQNLALPG